MSSDLVSALESTAAGSFTFSEQASFVTFSSDTLAQAAFRSLLDARVSSAPVYDRASGAWLGFLDMGDLAKHILGLYRAGDKAALAHLDSPDHSHSSLTVADVIDSTNNPFIPVRDTDSILKAIELFASSPSRSVTVHRVPVINAEGKLVKLITQNGVAQFLAAFEAELAPRLSHQIPKRVVVTVGEEDTVVKALETMTASRITALPIVDEDGKIITPISLTDVRAILRPPGHALQLLESPVVEFMQKVRLAQDARGGHKVTKALVCAIPETASYFAVLHKLQSLHIHRLYAEDAEGNVVGVISMKDILLELLGTLPDRK